MSSVAPRTGRLTFDDFRAMIRPNQQADLIDGVIYMASPESTDANKLGGWLERSLIALRSTWQREKLKSNAH